MKRSRPALFACVLLLALTDGLGQAAGPAGPAGPATHVVRIEGMKFTPNVISVQPGDTVEFVNTDLVPHTVTERSARAFDSGMLNAKATWKLVTDAEGTLLYRCVYHPDMTGKIIVRKFPQITTRHPAAAVELCRAP